MIGDRRQRGSDHEIVASELFEIGPHDDVERHMILHHPFDDATMVGKIGPCIQAVGRTI